MSLKTRNLGLQSVVFGLDVVEQSLNLPDVLGVRLAPVEGFGQLSVLLLNHCDIGDALVVAILEGLRLLNGQGVGISVSVEIGGDVSEVFLALLELLLLLEGLVTQLLEVHSEFLVVVIEVSELGVLILQVLLASIHVLHLLIQLREVGFQGLVLRFEDGLLVLQ